MKIGDRVKQKFTLAHRVGTIIGQYDKDHVIETKDGYITFAVAGEFKVKFDHDIGDGFTPMSESQLELIK